MTYFNAWLMTVNDDPFVWFYYIYGHTTFPPLAFFWICNKLSAPTHHAHGLTGYVGIEPAGAGGRRHHGGRIQRGPSPMILAICFTNFGPYHLARLRALALRMAEAGDRLLAYEVAGSQRLYPWQTAREESRSSG